MNDLVRITSSFTNESWEGEVALHGVTDEQKLDSIFRIFNRVTNDDIEHLRDLGYELPSISANDRIELNGTAWRVDAIGFSLDDRDPSEPLEPWLGGARLGVPERGVER